MENGLEASAEDRGEWSLHICRTGGMVSQGWADGLRVPWNLGVCAGDTDGRAPCSTTRLSISDAVQCGSPYLPSLMNEHLG